MTWVFFYPYTLLRMLVRPGPMLDYVKEESGKDPDIAFSSAMRPALFLLISLAIGTLLAPFDVGQIKLLQTSRLGAMVVGSWFALLLVRMIAFSFFPLAGAVIMDALTPGGITRTTMRTPFYLQCYICAPLALIASPALVHLDRDGIVVQVLFGLVVIWFLGVQFVFFRRFAGLGVRTSILLAPAVLLCGIFGMAALSLVLVA